VQETVPVSKRRVRLYCVPSLRAKRGLRIRDQGLGIRAQVELSAFGESANCARGDAAVNEQCLPGHVAAGFGREEDYG